MLILERIGSFMEIGFSLAADPINLAVLFGSVLLGIIFGAMPGLTSTLGVALLTALTYGMDTSLAMICLLSIYVGGTYGGSYASILINIPGTAAAAATAMDGYPLACKGEGGRAIGLTTTASAIGTIISMLFVVSISPIISHFALQFTSFEFFLLAFFGILISGTLTSPDLVIKGWIAGFLGLFLACIGRDQLQFFPRFTFGIPELDSGVEVVPVLIGAFGIPQIIQVLKDRFQIGEAQKLQRILPEIGTVLRNLPAIGRSALIGVGIGAVPGIGEDIAGWVSYGTAKNTSKHPETFGKGELKGVLASETANNACVGGAMIPLLNLGIPGSPPAAMLLGALMLHGVTPGPMITFEHPTFIFEVAAISAAGLHGHVGGRHAAGQAGGQGAAHSHPDLHAHHRCALHYRILLPGAEHFQPVSDASGGHHQLFSDPDGLPHRPAGDRGDSRTHGGRESAPGPDGVPGEFHAGVYPSGCIDPLFNHCMDGRQSVRMVPQNKELDLGATAARATRETGNARGGR
jgi:putative tricarboxylic transport membrane protein